MSAALSEIVEMIRATEAELARAGQVAAAHGSTVSTRLVTASLHHRLAELEQRFAAAATLQELDVCSYRMIADRTGRYPVPALTRALADFQQFVSVLYEAVRTNSPREKARISAETAELTTMDFAYSFAGSLGFVLTMPRERVLAGDAKLDLAVEAVFSLARAEDSETVSDFAQKYGSAPLRLAHRWAKAHVDAGISVQIQWKRDDTVTNEVLAQVSELERLADIIEEVGETIVEQVELYGRLVAGNINSGSFTLAVDGGENVRGHLHAEFRLPVGTDMSLGHYYLAKLEKHTRRHYATNRQVTTYFLLTLGAGPAATSSDQKPLV